MEERLNTILHIDLENGQARALVADTTALAAEAQRIHGCGCTASAALGRALTAGALLAALQKNEGDRLTLTFRGDGPFSPVVVVADGAGRAKGYCENPELELEPKPNGKLNVGGGVGANGRLIVVKDLGLREPYVGQTRLVSGEIAQDLAYYLAASEQTPSMAALGVRLEGGVVTASGGLLVQPLPGCPEETLTRLETLAEPLAAISTLLETCGSALSLTENVFGGFTWKVLDENHPFWRCDCSRARIERVLLSMGEAELRDMMAKQHGAQVRCHFCESVYDFTEGELAELLAEGRA